MVAIASEQGHAHPMSLAKLTTVGRQEERAMSMRDLLLVGFMASLLAAATPKPKPTRLAEPSYPPEAAASHVVTVTEEGAAAAGITVLTEAVAVKESGPRATLARFGETYAFSPTFIAVHRNEPTEISFWNLQPDDDHDFMLVAPDQQVLMKVLLPALRKTTYVFTFHDEGLFTFYCTMHQPEMSGQILVLPSP